MATIFLDMDGVVADFDAYAKEILGYSTPGGKRYPVDDWAKISANPRFYRQADFGWDEVWIPVDMYVTKSQHYYIPEEDIECVN